VPKQLKTGKTAAEKNSQFSAGLVLPPADVTREIWAPNAPNVHTHNAESALQTHNFIELGHNVQYALTFLTEIIRYIYCIRRMTEAAYCMHMKWI